MHSALMLFSISVDLKWKVKKSKSAFKITVVNLFFPSDNWSQAFFSLWSFWN